MTTKMNQHLGQSTQTKHFNQTGIYCMIKVLCCKAFRCVLLRKSAVLSTSLQSLYMALVYGKRHVLKTKTESPLKWESKDSRGWTRQQERSSSEKKGKICLSCPDTEMDRVKKIYNLYITADCIDLHHVVAVCRTNMKNANFSVLICSSQLKKRDQGLQLNLSF